MSREAGDALRREPVDGGSCDAVQERLVEAFLGHEAASGADAAHAGACAACGAHVRQMQGLAARLDALQVPPLRVSALSACEASALRVLRARSRAHAPAPLRGMGRDLLRAAALGLLALPVAVGHALFVAWAGNALLGPRVPAPVLAWLGAFYFVPVVLGLGVLYGAIPLAVAVGRRRAQEES